MAFLALVLTPVLPFHLFTPAQTIGFTGIPNRELVVYDYSLRRVFFCNKVGVFQALVQLPADAPTPSSFNLGYKKNLKCGRGDKREFEAVPFLICPSIPVLPQLHSLGHWLEPRVRPFLSLATVAVLSFACSARPPLRVFSPSHVFLPRSMVWINRCNSGVNQFVGYEIYKCASNCTLGCNNSGVCNEPTGVCMCQGNWGGPSCSRCLPGWTGTNCQVPVRIGFRLEQAINCKALNSPGLAFFIFLSFFNESVSRLPDSPDMQSRRLCNAEPDSSEQPVQRDRCRVQCRERALL
jgi:hypothetical protein